MKNKYLDMSPEELQEAAEAAMWAYTHKHEIGFDLSFEVSDTSWKCHFSTISLKELDEESFQIAYALMHNIMKSKNQKWYQKIFTPNFGHSLIVVSAVLGITILLSLFGR